MLEEADQIIFGDIIPTDGDSNQERRALARDRELLKEGHIHIRGRTRSGKTSLAIAPLIRQLIRPYTYRYVDADGEHHEQMMKDPIFIFDLGGDLSLFNYVKRGLCEVKEKDEHGNDVNHRNFRFLSLKKEHNWDYFDPFQIVPEGERDLIRLAQVLIEAFNQDYGLVYGASYYSMRSLSALMRVADKVVQQSKGDSHMDFHEVGRYLQSEHRPDRDEASIRMAFQFLMNYEQLRRPPADAPHQRQINWRRALDESEVVYFFCPSMGQATTARQVAGLGLYTLLATAQLRKDSGANQGAGYRHAWIIVDEFQELAGRSFASLLAQSSKFGISLILANQTTTQLENRDVNLAHVVRDNTLAKIYFTVTGRQDIEDLQAFSMDNPRYLSRTSQTGARHTSGLTETIVPMLDKDTILDTSSTNRHCLAIIDDGRGHHEPYRLETHYDISPDDYQRFKNTPPPSRNGPDRHPEPHAFSTKTDEIAERSNERQALLHELLDRKCRQEIPEYVAKQFCKAPDE